MGAEILQAIKTKKADFPALNRTVINGHVPAILRNFSEIKERNFHRSVIYRQAGREDYHQPSYIEQLFDYYAAAAFRSQARGALILAEIESWQPFVESLTARGEFVFAAPDYWELDEAAENMLSKARRAHVSGNRHEARLLLIEVREQVERMVRVVSEAVEGVTR